MRLKLNLGIARFLYRIAHRFGSILFDLDFFDQTADARVFEYSFVIARLSRLPPGKVLDVGCASRSNVLAPTMATLGWQVYGVDMRKFNLTYPGFQFIKGDVTNLNFPDHFFDAIYAVSTLEHIGLSGRYGVKENVLRADLKAASEIKRILKPGGPFLITIPYGRAKLVKSMERIYDKAAVNELTTGWGLSSTQYYMTNDSGEGWHPVPKETAAEADNVTNYAMVLLECRQE